MLGMLSLHLGGEPEVTLRADQSDIDAGFAAQERVLRHLIEHHHSGWYETRSHLLDCINEDGLDGMNINFEEKRLGDLRNDEIEGSMEVQCSPRSDNCYWTKSKYTHSHAEWQCFVYTATDEAIVISTERLRSLLGTFDAIRWNKARDPYILLWSEFLRNSGAIDLAEWCSLHKVVVK